MINALFLQFHRKRGAQDLIDLLILKLHAVQKRIDIQPRTARDDGEHSPIGDIIDSFCRQLAEARDREALARFDKIHQVMGYSLFFILGRLCRCDIHVLVDLHGIGGDDLTAEALGDLHRQGGLARGGRSDNGDNFLLHYSTLPNIRSSSCFFKRIHTGLPWGQWRISSFSTCLTKAISSCSVLRLPPLIAARQETFA